MNYSQTFYPSNKSYQKAESAYFVSPSQQQNNSNSAKKEIISYNKFIKQNQRTTNQNNLESKRQGKAELQIQNHNNRFNDFNNEVSKKAGRSQTHQHERSLSKNTLQKRQSIK